MRPFPASVVDNHLNIPDSDDRGVDHHSYVFFSQNGSDLFAAVKCCPNYSFLKYDDDQDVWNQLDFKPDFAEAGGLDISIFGAETYMVVMHHKIVPINIEKK